MATVNIHDANSFIAAARASHGRRRNRHRQSGKTIARLVYVFKPQSRKPSIARGEVMNAFFESLPDDELVGWDSENTARHARCTLVAI